jgi:arsenite-transporting ATPase
MERLLDLAPPGLDEIMALTAVIDHLDGKRYDTVVLDAAPSGHMLRLLELPELIEDWLRLFFRLLLKYRSVVRLPELSSRLVELSKSVKRLRGLLHDPHRAVAQVVTVPTQLALAETLDLTAALGRLGIAMPRLFVNQMTPPDDCDLHRALRAREAALLDQIRARLPGTALTCVYRQAEPVGLAALAALGRELYTLPALLPGRQSA